MSLNFSAAPSTASTPGISVDLLRFELCIAADNGDACVGGNGSRLTNNFTAFLVGILRNGARVDDENVGRLVEFYLLIASLFSNFREIVEVSE